MSAFLQVPVGAVAGGRATSLSDRYCVLLCGLLLGYATIGKGFAYIGIPPLFVGEVALLLGLLVALQTGCSLAILASAPGCLLVMMMSLVAMRMAPGMAAFGMEAARDSVVVMYGLFAVIVAALLLERPERLRGVLRAYSVFAWFYGFAGIALMNASALLGSLMPNWPGSGLPLLYLRLGEGATHLTGAAVFALLNLRPVGRVWVFIMVASVGMTTVSRGAMLACLVPLAVASVFARQKRQVGYVLACAAMLFVATYSAGVEIPLPGGRSIGPEQIVNGLESIVGTNTESNLDGTKTWRLNWWNAIVGYTINGPYFWTGKGFGLNLAEADGFVVGLELGGPTVRSPHSVHMTMLARTGVPGLCLWIATGGAWFGMLFRMMFFARGRGDYLWGDIFLWIACYGLSIIIDASFDVALEGPMLGIWFWCLFGFGIGVTMIYRAVAPGSRVSPELDDGRICASFGDRAISRRQNRSWPCWRTWSGKSR